MNFISAKKITFSPFSLFLISSQEIESQIDRICEMGEVMRKAVQVDDDQFCKIQEKLAQLEVRLLLTILREFSQSLEGMPSLS